MVSTARRGEDRVPAAIRVPNLEAVVGIPGEMPDSVAQVVKDRQGRRDNRAFHDCYYS